MTITRRMLILLMLVFPGLSWGMTPAQRFDAYKELAAVLGTYTDADNPVGKPLIVQKSFGEKLRSTQAAHADLFECVELESPQRPSSPSLEDHMAAAGIDLDPEAAASTVFSEYKLRFKPDTSLLFSQRILLTLYAEGVMQPSQMPRPLQRAIAMIFRLEAAPRTPDFVPDILRTYEGLCAKNDQDYFLAGGAAGLEKFSKKCGVLISIPAVLATLQHLQFNLTDGVRNGLLPPPANKLEAFSLLFLQANAHKINAQYLMKALHEYRNPAFKPAKEVAGAPTIFDVFKGFFDEHPNENKEWIDSIPTALDAQVAFEFTAQSMGQLQHMQTWAKNRYSHRAPTEIQDFLNLHRDWQAKKATHTTTNWWAVFKENLRRQWLGMGQMKDAQFFADLHAGLKRSGFIGPQLQKTLEDAKKMLQSIDRHLEGISLSMGGTIPAIAKPFYDLMAEATPEDLAGCNAKIQSMAAEWGKWQEQSWAEALHAVVNQGYLNARTHYHVQNMRRITAVIVTPNKLVTSEEQWQTDMRLACLNATLKA